MEDGGSLATRLDMHTKIMSYYLFFPTVFVQLFPYTVSDKMESVYSLG